MRPFFVGGRARLLLAASMIALCAGFVHAASMTISLVPVSSTVQLGGLNDPLIFDLVISNPDAVSVKSWALDFFYDPAVFAPLPGIGTVPTVGFELGPYIPGVSAQWNPTYENNGIAPDIARGGALNSGSGLGSASTGTLARLAFDAVGLSESSSVWLDGEIILSTGQVATVVFEPAQVAVLPEPATLLGVMLGLALFRRRRVA